ncbi:RICIN domain-containing protein [Actinoallomurus acanthiterrae]
MLLVASAVLACASGLVTVTAVTSQASATPASCVVGVLCEAEQATLTGAVGTGSDHNGYTGAGFAAGFTATGAALTDGLDVATAGTYELRVRYANGTGGDGQHATRTLSVSLDGGAPTTVTLPTTPSWDDWAIATVPSLTLTAGKHTLVITRGNNDSGNVNIDSFAVTTPGMPYPTPPPPPSYICGSTTNSEWAHGTTASAIGWAGNHQGVVACLAGSFVVKNTQQLYGYGVYNKTTTTWKNAEGYLPALITSFKADGAKVSITNFGDKVTIGGKDFVAVYSRVAVTNNSTSTITVDPQPTPGLVALNNASNDVPAGRTVVHDYAVFSDEFGATVPYPSDTQLRAAGGWAQHYAHMRTYWNKQLRGIAEIKELPDRTLIDAYKTGFIYTQITRDGPVLKTGVNGYDKEYSHDVIGIVANMLTQGFQREDSLTALDLLLRLRDVVGPQAQYDDGIWKYAWPWAIYLQKTGDLAGVKANFATPGPAGDAAQPSIKATAHAIAAARTGPGGIMHMTSDIDSNGYWTIDDYSALMGLAAYRWLAEQVGDKTESQWATNEYTSLLNAVNTTLTSTITKYHLNYLPCSMVEPNDKNRCSNPKDANWAAPFLFGRWAWDGYLFGAPIHGPGKDLIDATYDYGFGRLAGILPPNTFGGYGSQDYTTAYNAGYGEWGLAGNAHRDQSILSYQFMIANAQSGPYSWWEEMSGPDPKSPWVGNHPADGGGSSPHAWGAADANMALLDSLVVERGDGTLIVGRGVPKAWIGNSRKPITVDNMPITGGKRLALSIVSRGKQVVLTLKGDPSAGPILFQLPAFVGNIEGASTGKVDANSGTVTLPAGTRSVVVTLNHVTS